MERLYQEYKDIAEFRMVYIKEAHAADSDWSVPYAHEKGITEHDSYEERCTTAEMLRSDESLTIPCLIDDMKDSVNRKYHAWPDRVFVVRTDGVLAIVADPGPFGFKPALEGTSRWLAEFRKSGTEPKEAPPPAPAETSFYLPGGVDPGRLLGVWTLNADMRGRTMTATMTFTMKGGKVEGVVSLNGGESRVTGLEFDGEALTVWFEMGRRGLIDFAGAIEGDRITGKLAGTVEMTGKRTSKGH